MFSGYNVVNYGEWERQEKEEYMGLLCSDSVEDEDEEVEEEEVVEGEKVSRRYKKRVK